MLIWNTLVEIIFDIIVYFKIIKLDQTMEACTTEVTHIQTKPVITRSALQLDPGVWHRQERLIRRAEGPMRVANNTALPQNSAQTVIKPQNCLFGEGRHLILTLFAPAWPITVCAVGRRSKEGRKCHVHFVTSSAGKQHDVYHLCPPSGLPPSAGPRRKDRVPMQWSPRWRRGLALTAAQSESSEEETVFQRRGPVVFGCVWYAHKRGSKGTAPQRMS